MTIEKKVKLKRIRLEGGKSRVLTMTDFIPPDWIYVNVKLIESKNGSIVVEIMKVR